MDNQQEIVNYLAGIVDGEGSLQLLRKKRKNGKIQLYPDIDLVNTDKRIIDNIETCLKQLGIAYYIYKYHETYRRRARWTVRMRRITMVKKFLDLLLTATFFAKREEAILLLEFVNGRIGPNQIPYPSRLVENLNPYTYRDFEIYIRINTYGSHKFQHLQRAYAGQIPEDVLYNAVKAAQK